MKDFSKSGKELDEELAYTGSRYNKTYALMSEAGERLYAQRQEAILLIEEVENLVNSIASHPKAYEKDIQEIKVHKDQFRTAVEFGIEQRKVLEASAKSAGAGLAAGTAVAGMAPTAAMWVATTFGTASTGTAISALSGAAATNAALAWLGGGALAAGGGGMAAGSALLALAGPVGWGLAGTSLVVSIGLARRKKRLIQEKKIDEIARIKKETELIREIKEKIEAISVKTKSLVLRLRKSISSCEYMKGSDYTAFSDEQKQALGAIVNNTKALSALLTETVAE